MDYVSEVSPWMVAIKRLIQESKSLSPPCSPTLPSEEASTIEKLIKNGPIIMPAQVVDQVEEDKEEEEEEEPAYSGDALTTENEK